MTEAMQYLPPTLYFPALMIAVSLLGSAVLIIGFFVRYWMNNQEKKDKEQDEEIKSLRDDLADFKATLPRDYVLRDDFIRAVAGLELKVDRIGRDVGSISKGLARLLGGKDEDVCK